MMARRFIKIFSEYDHYLRFRGAYGHRAVYVHPEGSAASLLYDHASSIKSFIFYSYNV